MLKSITLLLFCLVLGASAHAQAILSFPATEFDFGNVPEGTMAAHEFRFQNTGNQPLVIANVQASCGCTTPEWTKAPVLPGKYGVVKAVYSSAGRPGTFNKTITITSNATEASRVLTIKGTVLTRDELKKNLTPAQLAQSPRLTLERSVHDFGKIETGQQPVSRFTVRNTGKTDLVLSTVTAGCYCVGLKNAPGPIRPGQSAVIELIYAPRKLGAAQEEVVISSNDLTGDARLLLKANVVKSLQAASMLKEDAGSVPFK